MFFFVALLTGTLGEVAFKHAREVARGHRELAVERAVTHAVNQSLELERVLNVALDQAVETLGVEAGSIFLADEKQTTLTLTITRGLTPQVRQLVQSYAFGESISGMAAAQRQVIVSTDLPNDPRIRPSLRSLILRAQVSVPLVTRDQVVGVLCLNAQNPRAFSDEAIDLLRAIGASVAMAIDHARLFATLEHRVAERTAALVALNRIASMANRSLDLDTILNESLDDLMHVLETPGAWVLLLEDATDKLTLHIERGSTPAIHHYLRQMRPDVGLRRISRGEFKPVVVDLTCVDPRMSAALAQAGYFSLVVVPLAIGKQLVGILGLAGERANLFSEPNLSWLGAVSDTLGIAINNARLFESVEQQVKQLATLREIDYSLSSMLELEPLLELMLGLLALIVPYDSAAVMLLEGQQLRTFAARGQDQEHLLSFVLNATTNDLFQSMARENMPIILDDLTQHESWVRVPGIELKRAWLGVPLTARGEVIGEISLLSAVPGAFTREHSNLVMAFAHHAAVTIANARLRAELQDQARRDSLTGALNHGAFIESLHQAAQTNNPLALIMLDLDNYKRYNDQYGHVVGDRVLGVTVQAIRAHIKQSDFVGRWGGEEFCIALLNSNSERAAIVAARIRKTLSTTRIENNSDAPIPPPTASQGIAAFPESAANVDELIDRADRALYQAKSRGRDQVVIWASD